MTAATRRRRRRRRRSLRTAAAAEDGYGELIMHHFGSGAKGITFWRVACGCLEVSVAPKRLAFCDSLRSYTSELTYLRSSPIPSRYHRRTESSITSSSLLSGLNSLFPFHRLSDSLHTYINHRAAPSSAFLFRLRDPPGRGEGTRAGIMTP